MKGKSVSIIIVSYKVKSLLKKCLESVFQHTYNLDFEVIVVDNNSRDGTGDMIKYQFPEVKFIQNNENLGFAKANNIAIKQAKGDYILLLNPDTELHENSLEMIVNKMDQDHNIGILGCKLLNSDLSLQKSVRRFPNISSQISILLKLHHLFPSILDNYLANDFDYEKEQMVDQVMGAFFCIKKKLVSEIGLLDEDYYIWFEEVDFCKRALNANWKTLYYPYTSIIHHGSQSFNQKMTLQKQAWFLKSMYHYLTKHK